MTQHVTIAEMTGLATPADLPGFDPDHPDAEILEAIHNVHRHRAWVYAKEDINQGDWPGDTNERLEEQELEYERGVMGNYPTTPAGAAAQLLLLIPMLDQARWVDRDLAEQGLRPFYDGKKTLPLDGSTQLAIGTAYALIDMEWTQALEAYERSEEDYRLALKLADLCTIERAHRGAESGAFLRAVESHAATLEERHSNDAVVQRLLRTLTPDFPSYQRKAEIAIKEMQTAEAAVWLLRDVHFLMGNITPPKEA